MSTINEMKRVSIELMGENFRIKVNLDKELEAQEILNFIHYEVEKNSKLYPMLSLNKLLFMTLYDSLQSSFFSNGKTNDEFFQDCSGNNNDEHIRFETIEYYLKSMINLLEDKNSTMVNG